MTSISSPKRTRKIGETYLLTIFSPVQKPDPGIGSLAVDSFASEVRRCTYTKPHRTEEGSHMHEDGLSPAIDFICELERLHQSHIFGFHQTNSPGLPGEFNSRCGPCIKSLTVPNLSNLAPFLQQSHPFNRIGSEVDHPLMRILYAVSSLPGVYMRLLLGLANCHILASRTSHEVTAQSEGCKTLTLMPENHEATLFIS